MRVTASALRQDIYRILDQVIETGEVVEIERKGKVLRILPPEPQRRLDRLTRHPAYIVGDPDDFVHIDWSEEWSGEPELGRGEVDKEEPDKEKPDQGEPDRNEPAPGEPDHEEPDHGEPDREGSGREP